MGKNIRELKLARGLLFHEDKVLLVKDLKPEGGHYFLPGGSVEPGESVRAALSREWKEELGWKIQVGDFIGCLENHWSYRRKKNGKTVDVFEINYLFRVKVTSKLLTKEPKSLESHLGFFWVPLRELKSLYLLPSPLKKLLPEIAASKSSALWCSTLS